MPPTTPSARRLRLVAALGRGPAGHDRRRDPRLHRAGPAGRARPAPVGQHHARGARAADDPGDPHAAGLQRLPDHPADHDADPAGAERRDDAAGPDPRRRPRARRGRRRDPGLRRVRRGRPGRRRGDPVPDPGRHPVRRDHQGGDADQRGRRAVHARRPARPPDGDRRRPPRRPDRPARGRTAAARPSIARPTSSAPWTGPASSSGATPSPGVIITLVNIGAGLFLGRRQPRDERWPRRSTSSPS